MQSQISRRWFHSLFALFTLAALIACGGKKSGDASSVDVNAGDIPKVTTAGGGGDGGSKDSETGNPNDICNREGDAYTRFATYTNHPRDYVFKIAKDAGFDALYTAHPATLAAADLSVMYNYYAQADLQVFGKLNAEIELKLAEFHANLDKGEWKSAYKDNSGLMAMLQARRSLFAFYSNIFGLNGYTWLEGKDLDGEVAATYKPIRDKVASDASLTAAQKAELDYAIVETARYSTVRVEEKDYVLHATFAGENVLKIELVAVATGYNYATYKQYTVAEYAAMNDRATYYNTAITTLEANYDTTYKNKDTMTAAEFATATYTFQQQYRDYVAARDVVLSFAPSNYVRANGTSLNVNYYPGNNTTTTTGTGSNGGDGGTDGNSK